MPSIGVLTPPQKHHPLFFAKSPPAPSFLGNYPYLLVFREAPLKTGFFSETP